MVHLRGRHEHHERRECQQENRGKSDCRLRLDVPNEAGEGVYRRTAENWCNEPGSAQEHAEHEMGGATWRKLSELMIPSADDVQRTKELGEGADTIYEMTGGINTCLIQLNNFVDEEWTRVEDSKCNECIERGGGNANDQRIAARSFIEPLPRTLGSIRSEPHGTAPGQDDQDDNHAENDRRSGDP